MVAEKKEFLIGAYRKSGKGGQEMRERCVAYSATSVPVYIGFFTPM